MKKFGTPSGAGPGRAKLNVGFSAVGTPPGPVALGCATEGLAVFFAFLLVEVDGVGAADAPPELRCEPPDRFEPDPDLEPEPEPLLVPLPLPLPLPLPPGFLVGDELLPVVVPLPPPLVVVEPAGVVVVVVWQDSVFATTVPTTGMGIDERGVPGATLTVNVSFWPVASVTVTVQVWAWASDRGIAARAVITAPSVISQIHSFRRIITLFRFLPPALRLH
jgi:hypothetical protein